MVEYTVLRTMRSMAWKRARGELESMFPTFWACEEDGKYDKLRTVVDKFIDEIECNELHT